VTARAYAWTKERIVDGTYAGGELISEGQVAAALAVSRTPVREAFLRLSADGFLQLFPKRGAVVVAVTAGEVADVLGARQLVEGWAAQQVAVAGDPTRLLEELGDCLERQRTAALTGDHRAFQEADRAFHHAVVRAAGNGLLVAFHRTLRDRQLRMGASAVLADPRRTDRILTEHAQLLARLAAGDPDGARRVSDAHLAATRTALTTRTGIR
jgi:DNA-binding GntR family transcriptional regulator